MEMQNPNILLARWHDEFDILNIVTIQNYNDLIDTQDKDKIADFFYHRMHSRYIKPFQYDNETFKKNYKNGFSIMASCCLLIEAVQSFKNGWETSDKKSEKAFKEFLQSEKNFKDFNKKEKDFYKNIRCGILHQGETTGGWKISRIGDYLFEDTSLTINSVRFLRELEFSLQQYTENLKTEKWDSDIWDNFRIKMRKVISNCES